MNDLLESENDLKLSTTKKIIQKNVIQNNEIYINILAFYKQTRPKCNVWKDNPASTVHQWNTLRNIITSGKVLIVVNTQIVF